MVDVQAGGSRRQVQGLPRLDSTKLLQMFPGVIRKALFSLLESTRQIEDIGELGEGFPLRGKDSKCRPVAPDLREEV